MYLLKEGKEQSKEYRKTVFLILFKYGWLLNLPTYLTVTAQIPSMPPGQYQNSMLKHTPLHITHLALTGTVFYLTTNAGHFLLACLTYKKTSSLTSFFPHHTLTAQTVSSLLNHPQ
jgi:hypothetical protein